MKKILCVLMLLASIFSIVACDNDETNEDEDSEPAIAAKVGMFFKPNKHSNSIYTIHSSVMTKTEYVMIASLQGIVAQTNASIYIIEDEDDQHWLDESVEKYNINVTNITNAWDMVTLFAEYLNENKYVLYEHTSENGVSYDNQTINYATTVSGVEKYLMISKTLEETAISKGFVKGIDVTTNEWNTEYVFTTYKDKLNPAILFHQRPDKGQLRDYSIAAKALCFYSDYTDGSDDDIKIDILQWSNPNAPILGWTENEINFIAANSLLGKVTLAADWAANLSFHSSIEEEGVIEQPNYQKEKITAQDGKHYVAIVMSDGDNIQWLLNSFASSSLYFGSEHKGDFKMTWTMSPSLYDLAPNVLQTLYNSSPSNNEFIAGPSGVGYINAAEYNSDLISEYAAYTAGYLEKTDTHAINFLDNYFDETAYKEFAKYDQVSGGVVSVGDFYLEGGGGVYWSNDKPFISVREVLWRSDSNTNHNNYYGYIERVAQRINEYSTDPTTIEGYTVVLCHAWSIGNMEYLSRFVECLDENIELVTVSELIDLVKENVVHENVESLDDVIKEDFDNNLAPISTEQYNMSDYEESPILSERSFLFVKEHVAEKWMYSCGGLQYDSAGWNGQSVVLDGSDLDDRLDTFPNSWMNAKFTLGEEDKYLQLKVNGGINADTNLRVRAIYSENNKLVSEVLLAEEYEKELNSSGYYLLNSNSSPILTYDISKFCNKTVMISIEQDDSGEGSGELVVVNKISIGASFSSISSLNSWNVSQIIDEWNGVGNIVRHEEGICLENYGTESSISCKLIVPDDMTTFRFSVRKFIRVDQEQDADAKIVVKVNDEVIREISANDDYIIVNKGEFSTFSYDLSEFSGQTVTISIITIAGEHACIDNIYFK